MMIYCYCNFQIVCNYKYSVLVCDSNRILLLLQRNDLNEMFILIILFYYTMKLIILFINYMIHSFYELSFTMLLF